MSTKKLNPAAVEALVKNAANNLIGKNVLGELLARIKDLLPDESPAEEKPPQKKKQFVVLVSDPLHKMPEGEDFAAWVLQIPESDSPLSTHERIETAAVNFNGSKRGRMLPVQTVGEALEGIPAKAFKEVDLWCKTKTPVLVVITRNELPNTPGLFHDDERNAAVDGFSKLCRENNASVEIRTDDKVIHIDGNGISDPDDKKGTQ